MYGRMYKDVLPTADGRSYPVLAASLTVDPAFRVGEIDRRLFGSFVEHMGRCVYTGIFEPGHPAADDRGFRRDVLALTRELGVTLVRYPGGNFVSGYRWEDGIGPVAERPTRLDLAWRSIEPNTFGLDEFMAWAAEAGVQPMMAVNLGSRGIQEAADLIEYTNHPGGTRLSDLRKANGASEPYGVTLWCLGNELDGPWQVGHKTADEYGRLAAETARAMRMVDPSIELVACGSSNPRMSTFGAWEATVLGHTYELVDYLSLHSYYEERPGDRGSFLAASVGMDRMISEILATADHVGAVKGSAKKMKLSFDEWNVWYEAQWTAGEQPEWEHAPRLIEDEYSVVDAVVVGSLLMTLLNHADRVSIACQAQLANIIAPIRTEPGGPAWRQSIFHPFAATARLAKGSALVVRPVCPTYPTDEHGDVPVLATAASYDDESGALSLFLVNRSTTEPLLLDADLRSLPGLCVAEHLQLCDDHAEATNTADHPERVQLVTGSGSRLQGGRLQVSLPPLSWSVLHLRPDAPATSM